jgi:hypothetical protein
MTAKPTKTSMIFLRLPGGWSEPIENRDPKRCDIDGAPTLDQSGIADLL